MQRLKPEYTETVLQLLREGKSEKEIALATKRHRNTVSRYVNYLRTNYHIDFKLLQNEVLSELQTRINGMEDRDLVRFLACLLPQKIEASQSGEILHRIELVDPDSVYEGEKNSTESQNSEAESNANNHASNQV